MAALIAGGLLYWMDPLVTASAVQAAIVFAVLSAVCEMLAYKKAGRSESGSIAFLPILASVILAPNWVTVGTVTIATLLVQVANRRVFIKGVFNVVQAALWVALSIAAYKSLGGTAFVAGSGPYLPAFVASLLVFAVVNSAAVSGAIAISEQERFWGLWSSRARVTVMYDLFTLPCVYVFAYCYVEWGALGATALVVPALGIRALYKVNWELEQTNHELLQLMVAAIEARDPYTSGHSRRVSRNSRLIAQAIGLPDKQVERVAVAALLHDVGKIHEVFAPILSKPGRLTAEENAIMQTHPVKSEELVRMVSQLKDVVSPIRHHHENWDGTGYPDGLMAENIPIASRIIMFADTIDAMTTDRPYRGALTETQVRAEFVKLRGRQFDPSICDQLLSSPIYLKLFDQDVPLTPAIAGQERWKTPAPVPLLAS
ncbi:MAG: HD-GYP domain-containing protein [Gemmatimonadota bacterium]|nr:HD-GYP domain-containing protein [Gemmatimonadota bacterium]